MSDPIEGRFGWYQQASGGNFFISERQLMLTQKNIKILILLQQNVLLQASKISSELATLEQMIDGDDASLTPKDFWTNQFEEFRRNVFH